MAPSMTRLTPLFIKREKMEDEVTILTDPSSQTESERRKKKEKLVKETKRENALVYPKPSGKMPIQLYFD
jgi:hypothetical protein